MQKFAQRFQWPPPNMHKSIQKIQAECLQSLILDYSIDRMKRIYFSSWGLRDDLLTSKPILGEN